MKPNIVQPQNWIAVLGGATQYSEKQIIAAYRIGEALARKGKNLVTGATTGIPYAAAIGAKSEGALVMGISPASSFEEHIEQYKKPLDYTDFMAFSGMGFDGRSPIIVRSVYGAIFVGGEFGTLNEFSSTCLYGNKVIGILQGVGGISDHLQDILGKIKTNWGNPVIFDSDPVKLVNKVCIAVDRIKSAQDRLRFQEVGKDVHQIVSKTISSIGSRAPGECIRRIWGALVKR